MPALNQNALTLLASLEVDMNIGTAQELYTVPSGKDCIITHIVVKDAQIELDVASYSFGFTGATYDDVIADATHTELVDDTLQTVLAAKAGAKVGVAADILKLLVNTLQGDPATATVDIFGYLI
jgi:hypothetical protein